MATKSVTGHFDSQIDLYCQDAPPPTSGRWKIAPKDHIPANSPGFEAFVCGDNTDVSGSVTYAAGDGTKFKLWFRNEDKTQATISCSDGMCGIYSYSADVPDHANDIVVTWKITQKTK